jgi:hypothetical protein
MPDTEAETCAEAVFAGWVSTLAAAMEGGDARAFAGLFAPDGYWKDILAFT